MCLYFEFVSIGFNCLRQFRLWYKMKCGHWKYTWSNFSQGKWIFEVSGLNWRKGGQKEKGKNKPNLPPTHVQVLQVRCFGNYGNKIMTGWHGPRGRKWALAHHVRFESTRGDRESSLGDFHGLGRACTIVINVVTIVRANRVE